MRSPPEGSDMTPGWPAIWWGKGVWSPGVSVGSIAGPVWSAIYAGEHVVLLLRLRSGSWVYVILFVCLCTLHFNLAEKAQLWPRSHVPTRLAVLLYLHRFYDSYTIVYS